MSVLRKISFQKTTGGSYKAYQIKLEHDEHSGKYFVESHWGRIGTAGQTTRAAFADQAAAEEHIREKMTRRYDRGYLLVLDENPCASVPAPSGRPSYDLSSDKRPVSMYFDADIRDMRYVDGTVA